MKSPKILGLAFAMLFVLSGCERQVRALELHFTTPEGKTTPTVQAELALTRSERTIGLMYRKQLGDLEGMLFVFNTEEPRSFWMRNTYVELDMVYLDKDLKVVSIYEKAVPLSEEPRPSAKPAQFVLEVRGGKAKQWGVVPGSVLHAKPAVPLATD